MAKFTKHMALNQIRTSATDVREALTNNVVANTPAKGSQLLNETFASLSSSVWQPYLPWMNGTFQPIGTEAQYYTNDTNNYTIGSGITLVGKKELTNGYSWSSRMIVSTASYKYGYFEAKLTPPAGQGSFPAFWLFKAPSPITPNVYREIDIVEWVGKQPNAAYHTIHYGTSWNNRTAESKKSTYASTVLGVAKTYALYWTSTTIEWYVDGNRVAANDVTSKDFNYPMNIILNLAVGGDWPGAPDGTTPTPLNYGVEYVKVWGL